MTFIMNLKVADGIIIAGDSTTTMNVEGPDGRLHPGMLFRGGNKIVNLVRGLPIGVSTFGLGAINGHSNEFLLKELRMRLMKPTSGFEEWVVDPTDFTMASVAERTAEFVYQHNYLKQWEPPDRVAGAGAGFFLAGISSDQLVGELYRIEIQADGSLVGPVLVSASDVQGGVIFDGMIEGPARLFFGFSPFLMDVLVNHLGLAAEDVQGAAQILREQLMAGMITDAMPIQDAIDLSVFMVDVAIKWTRFTPQEETVGGAIEVATLTKHEGFKWVRRKHFYNRDLNP